MDNSLIHGDCISFLNQCGSNVFDLIIADPPYFEIHGEFDFIWNNLEEYLSWCQKWITECHRTLKDTGSFYLWGKIGYSKGYSLFKIANWIEENKLFIIRNWITQKNSRGRGTKRGYMEAREELLFMTKTNSYYWEPAYTQEPQNRKDLGFDGKPRKNKFKRCSDVWTDIAEASQSSKERFVLPNGTLFPTVKSQKLCERILLASSQPNDLIFIPFGGSGSEVVAAKRLNRRYVVTELNFDYFQLIEGRLQSQTE